jgi:hypothetical protein
MPAQPPFSTIHRAVAAALSIVGSRPRPFVTSPSRLPASDASQSHRASWTLFGSPPPRSSRMIRAVSFWSSERIDGVARRFSTSSRPPSRPHAGINAAWMLVEEAVYGY